MRIRIGMVCENNNSFLNQVKICLYSLRKNGGALSDVPVTLITNSEPLDANEKSFLEEHFSPIEFRVCPRLGAVCHASKYNVFYAIEPSSYDILMYMDCDTVVRKPLDHILDQFKNKGTGFLCKRGGETDRNLFVDFNALVDRFCGEKRGSKISFEGKDEWSMFNTGVFLATSETVTKIRKDTIDFIYTIFNEHHRIDAVEKFPFIRYLYKMKIINSRQIVLQSWTIDQGAIALACIKAGVQVSYMDEIYNSWGNIDFSILHCFKSAYKFDRNTMFSADADGWLNEYDESGLTGKVFLAKLVREFIQEFPKPHK